MIQKTMHHPDIRQTANTLAKYGIALSIVGNFLVFTGCEKAELPDKLDPEITAVIRDEEQLRAGIHDTIKIPIDTGFRGISRPGLPKEPIGH